MQLVIERFDPWAEGYERLATRTRDAIQGVVVHRIEVSQEDSTYRDDPFDVLRFFREHPIGVGATGGDMPYPVLITPDGRVTQTLPLLRISPHAVRHNPTTIGVAALGDFRREPPSALQREALVWVCAALLAQCQHEAPILFGHDELSEATRDPNKECPGRHLDMNALRAEVAARRQASMRFPAFYWE